MPISARISALSSPNIGARRYIRDGVRVSLIGWPASFTGRAPTCSISGSISRAATCGSSKMSAIVFTGPAATKRESVSTISSRVLTAVHWLTIARISAAWA